MQFTSSFFAVIALSLVSLAEGAAVAPRAALDVFVPQILSPTAETVWTIGKVETVVWDTSKAPINISNGAAVSISGVSGFVVQGFNLRSGSVNLTVPATVTPGVHTITLFGDSGNISPPFQIVAA